MAITDEALWHAETRLWLEGAPAYRELVSGDAVMTLPEVGILDGAQATEGASGWQDAQLTERRLVRSDKDVIAIAYRGDAKRTDGSAYSAYCASTYHAVGGDWQLIQHSQTVID
ncbi:hypothetical protein [Qipengyuania sp. JC766]|uniref:hypothetical protein n=1 Tax=Qipengyuania sp. JC766 TaxID=3232139 RepID=UPI00345B3B40